MIVFQEVVAADQKYSFANQAGNVTFDIHSDNPFNVGVSFGRDTGIGAADYYLSPHSIQYGISPFGQTYNVGGQRFNGTVFIYTQTPIGGATIFANAPASSITIVGYSAGQQPKGSTSLSRMLNQGNAVPLATSASSVQNDGAAALTPIVEATQVSSSSSNLLLDNAGNATFAQYVAGVLTNLFQVIANSGAAPAVKIGAVGKIAQVLGDLQVSGSGLMYQTSGDLLSIANNDTFLKARGGKVVLESQSGQHDLEVSSGNVQINGNATITGSLTTGGTFTFSAITVTGTATVGGLAFSSGRITFADGSHVSEIHSFSGSGSGTFNHNCSAKPDTIMLTCANPGGGSQTMGYNPSTLNSTTVQVTAGAGLPWVGLAIVH